MRKKYKTFCVFDFETTGKQYFKKHNKVEVRYIATSQYVDMDFNHTEPKIVIHKNSRKWLEFIFKKRNKTTFYANNLRNFDGEFLISILNNNLDLIDEIHYNDFDRNDKSIEKITSTAGLENYDIGDKAIKILATNSHKIIMICLRTKKGKLFYFKCLLNLMNMSVKNMLSILKMNKEIDEIKNNEDYSVYDCSQKEFNKKLYSKSFKEKREKYIKLDIIACYKYIQLDRKNNKFSPFEYHRKVPLTAATHAWETGKKLIKKNNNQWVFNDLFKGNSFCKEHKNKYHQKLKCYKKKYYQSHLTETQYSIFSNLSRGGFTFLNDKYINTELKNVYSIDMNSEYPTAYSIYNQPCGKPTWLKKIPEPELGKIYCIIISLKKARFLENPDIYPPFLPRGKNYKIKGRYIVNFTATAKTGNIDLLIWDDELELINKYYYLEYTTKAIYQFNTTNVIAHAMKPLIDIKFKTTNKAQKQGAKLLINSFYGKWIEKIDKEGKDYIFNNDSKSDNHLKIFDTFNKSTLRAWKYPPVGNYIAAKSRILLYTKIEEIISLGGTVYYGDTDSVKFTCKNWKKIGGTGKKLGEWDIEWKNYKFKYLAPKTYAYHNGKNWFTKMKGYTQNVDYNHFKYGMVLKNRLTGKRVDGGKLLINMDYTINQNPNLIDI